jgi:hypothetical protein
MKFDTLHKVIGAFALLGPSFNSKKMNQIILAATSVDSLISGLEDAKTSQNLTKDQKSRNRSPRRTP